MLTDIADVAMRLNIFYHIMLKVFTMNDFICSFYFEMFLLQIIVIDVKYL